MILKFSFVVVLLMLLDSAFATQMIYNCTDLQGMQNNLTGSYALANNIDCSATATWNAGAGFAPVGTALSPFKGTFNGQSCTINNLVINRPSVSYTGMFGFTNSGTQIQAVGLVAVNVSGLDNVGGLVGYNNAGTISNSYAIGSSSGYEYIGGLVGYNNGGTISNSYASSNVIGQYTGVGGLAGRNYVGTITNSYATGSVSVAGYIVGGLVGANSGTITQCHATGNVTASNAADSTSRAGGLIGESDGGTITQCYATGTILASGSYVGGLLGMNFASTNIIQCYATGSVSGSSNVGGLAGTNVATIANSYATGNVLGSSNVGGLVGLSGGDITNSYAIGRVVGLSNVGGLIGSSNGNGYTYSGGAYSSYWDIQTSGQTTSIGGIGKNTIALYHNATYLSWDFNCIWSINEGKNTPQLTLNNCATPPQRQMQVSNCDELQLSMFLYSAFITVIQDIDCSVSATWDNGAGFYPGLLTAGSFDGLGHRIVNLMINRTSAQLVGLFGETAVGVQIKNVILEQTLISGYSYVGSLVGYNQGVITQCCTTGSVFGSNYVGGLVGSNNQGVIIQCYAASNVLGSDSIGGLAGLNLATITNSYATGNTSGLSIVGGLVGYDYGTITNSYAIGNVSGSGGVGGLVGGNSGDTVLYAYWDIQTSKQTSSAGGTGLFTAAMQQSASFVGWDFSGTWVINAGYTYPLLQAFVVFPVLSSPLNNITHNIGTLFTFTIPTNTFTDPNGLRLTYNVKLISGSPLPAWLFFEPSTQTFVGTPLSGAQGTLSIVVSVYNLPNQLTIDIFQLTILNRPPILNAPFAQQVALNGQTFQFVVPDATFFDADGDRLQLNAATNQNTPLPAWLSFNAALGIFSGTSTQRGNQWINVTASDGFGGQVSALLQIITPNTAPKTTGTFPNQVVVIAQLFSFTIPANLFSDLDGDLLTYSASLFGGGQLLSWLNFNPQTLAFQGTPDAIGFLVVSVIATDPYNATTSLNFGVSVSALAGNAPPLLAIQMLDQTATVGQLFTLALPANMFIDPNGYPLTYSAMLEGGAPLPSWLNFSATSLIFSGVSPTTGSLHITVKADNGGGGFALDTFTLTILSDQHLPPFLQNPISNQVASVGGNYQFTIPSNTFIDVNNAALTYTATTSGNGRLPGWLHFNTNTRTFAGTPSNTDTNIYSARITTIEVRATNGIGSAVTTFQLSVTGTSQAAQIINVLITLASIASTAFAVYRNRAFLWNTFFKRKYEKEPKKIALNEPFTYQFTIPSEKIMSVEAFNKAPPMLEHKKWCKCFQGIGFNRYQKLPDKNELPEWLQFNRKTITLTGTATEPADLYICAVGYDGRYLEAFKLRCGEPQGKDVEMQNI